MTYFARIENGIVADVIAAEQDFIDTGALGDPQMWVQTSYNTRGNVHYGQDGKPDGGIALRGNYAGIGYIYNAENDVFYAPQPYASWVLNEQTWLWEAPVPYPDDNKIYDWDENSQRWVLSF